MSDADVSDVVLDLVGADLDWTEENLNKALESTGWCFSGVTSRVLDYEAWATNEQLEAPAEPRMDVLRELLAQRASDWLPGAISVPYLDEWEPFGYLIQDNGLPLMVQLRACQNPN